MEEQRQTRRHAASAGDSNKGGIYDPAVRVKRIRALRTAKNQEKPSLVAVEALSNLLPRVLQAAVTTGAFTGSSSSLLFPAPGSPKTSLIRTCVLTRAGASRPSEQSETCPRQMRPMRELGMLQKPPSALPVWGSFGKNHPAGPRSRQRRAFPMSLRKPPWRERAKDMG